MPKAILRDRKVCERCGQNKHHSQFMLDKREEDGLSRFCIQCGWAIRNEEEARNTSTLAERASVEVKKMVVEQKERQAEFEQIRAKGGEPHVCKSCNQVKDLALDFYEGQTTLCKSCHKEKQDSRKEAINSQVISPKTGDWAEEEVTQLISLWNQGLTVAEICLKLHRFYNPVSSKILNLKKEGRIKGRYNQTTALTKTKEIAPANGKMTSKQSLRAIFGQQPAKSSDIPIATEQAESVDAPIIREPAMSVESPIVAEQAQLGDSTTGNEQAISHEPPVVAEQAPIPEVPTDDEQAITSETPIEGEPAPIPEIPIMRERAPISETTIVREQAQIPETPIRHEPLNSELLNIIKRQQQTINRLLDMLDLKS